MSRASASARWWNACPRSSPGSSWMAASCSASRMLPSNRKRILSPSFSAGAQFDHEQGSDRRRDAQLLAHLPYARVERRLPRLHIAAGHVPVRLVGGLDEQDPVLLVDEHCAGGDAGSRHRGHVLLRGVSHAEEPYVLDADRPAAVTRGGGPPLRTGDTAGSPRGVEPVCHANGSRHRRPGRVRPGPAIRR